MARPGWRPQSPAAYSYLLGAYLGDGHIVVFSPGSASLIITLNSTYPAIIAEVHEAVAAAFPEVGVHEFLRMGGSVTAVQANHPALPFAFPQHGPGKKHTRRIILSEWQRELTHAYPKEPFAVSSTPTAAGRSTVSGRSCPADGSPSMSIRGTSSQTSLPTSA
jgi:hypothetical protein